MGKDIIKGKVLKDGRVKSWTDDISDANHSDAQQFFDLLQGHLGGEMTAEPRHSHGAHVHEHQHEVDHEHN